MKLASIFERPPLHLPPIECRKIGHTIRSRYVILLQASRQADVGEKGENVQNEKMFVDGRQYWYLTTHLVSCKGERVACRDTTQQPLPQQRLSRRCQSASVSCPFAYFIWHPFPHLKILSLDVLYIFWTLEPRFGAVMPYFGWVTM